jgi:riboflavin synthase
MTRKNLSHNFLQSEDRCDARLHPASRRLQHATMFTGIVEETGTVEAIKPTKKSITLVIGAKRIARGVKLGASVAVNGCCLTVVKMSTRSKATLLQFDVLQESWQRTNLQFLETGSIVNLERPLRADGELGGHFVTGHVDGVGKIVRWEKSGADHMLDIIAPSEVMRYVVFKGSIAVDGISLTVAGVTKRGFRLWIIPHTFELTTLRERKVGDALNLEADLLGKYAEKFMSAMRRG